MCDQTLRDVLVFLFGRSAVLEQRLLPALLDNQPDTARIYPPAEIGRILVRSMDTIRGWDADFRAQFIEGHPRIGEPSPEQAENTSAEVLRRLAHLNMCYERVYPRLRYITFVNGRTRAVIVEEMEHKLGLTHSTSPDQPPLESFVVIEKYSLVWRTELDRAIDDVERIAQSRLAKLPVGS